MMSKKWQVVREDDNGNVFIIQGNLPKPTAIKLADEFSENNTNKPHPHKQFYWAETKRPRLG